MTDPPDRYRRRGRQLETRVGGRSSVDEEPPGIREASVGKNLVMKRFHARARGNSGGVEKFFSQITIVVEEKGEAEKKEGKPEAKAEAKPAAKKSEGKSPAKKPAAKKPAAKKSGKEKA